MKSELYVFLTHDAQAPLSFAKASGHGQIVLGAIAPGEPAPAAARADRVIAVAPGEDVAILTARVPARSEIQARTAARFAIEDDVAQPVDALHIALAPRQAGSTDRVIGVVDQTRWSAWRDRLAATGLTAEAATPDYLLLPTAPGDAFVLDTGDRVLARAGQAGLAIDADVAPAVLGAFLERASPSRIVVRSDRADALLARLDQTRFDIERAGAATPEEVVELIRTAVEAGLAIDLAADQSQSDLGPWLDPKLWRRAGALAAVALVSYTGLLYVETRVLRAQADRAFERATAIVAETFPDISRVVNPRAQMRERLSGMGGAGSLAFLELSALLADSLSEIDTLEVETLRFDEARAELAVSIVYDSYEDVERLRAALQARGGALEEGGSRQRGGAMTSEVVVRPGS